MITFRGKRLVVFGCGYVGTAVAQEALRRGLNVTALTRNPEKAASLREQGIAVQLGDLASREWHARIPGGADYVLNAVSSGGGGVDGYRNSYVDGMHSIADWATAGGGVGTIVYTSSTSVYPQDHAAIVTESDKTEGSGELPQLLIEAEKILLSEDWSNSSSNKKPGSIRRGFVLRLAGIYGPGRTHLIDQVRSGSVSGNPDHHLNLAHRDDIARAIWATFESSPSLDGGIFNVADDGAARKGEITEWLAQQLRVPAPTFTGLPVAGRRAVTPDRIISNAKLKAVLNWQPLFPTFREGYKNMLALNTE
ncbi:MAG: NAD-dependent epimerase/dehydratase family protein [Opitutus sp.]